MSPKAFLIFSLDDRLYALPAEDVKHIIRSVTITPLPDGPDLMAGILNMGGRFIPVIDIRKQFNLPSKTLLLSDRFIIAEACGYTIAFIADTVESVVELSAKPLDASNAIFPSGMEPASLFPGMEKFITGVSHQHNRTVLIYDVNSLFPETEIRLAADALKSKQTQEPI